MSAALALAAAAALAGCGTTTYFDGRKLPPSGLLNRVMIAIQNPSILTKGALQIVDAYYDVRFSYNSKTGSFSISGFAGALPVTIQNMPEEQFGAVYGSGDGSFNYVNYQTESNSGNVSGLNGASSSIFTTRDQKFVFAASQAAHVLSIIDKSTTGAGNYYLSLPGIYRISVNPGGSAVLAFVQNSNYVYYPVKLNASQTVAYSAGPSVWPKAAVDCEPQNAPGWCLMQAQSPDSTDQYGLSYGAPLSFNRPVKAVFSPDGASAYLLNCGPECGGTVATTAPTPATASLSVLPVSPILFTANQASGSLPKTGKVTSIAVPGGASNALQSGTTMYVIGQQLMSDGFFGGYLTVVNLSNNTAGSPVSISDGAPGAISRIILADDNTLWIGMQQCTNGERINHNQAYGCLTMVSLNGSTGAVSSTQLLSYLGDATGIAAVTGLHKVYTAEGGQVYIYSTVDGSTIDNQYVTVTGTAYDVAYMDGISDGNNTVY